jgi:hypothetical protein
MSTGITTFNYELLLLSRIFLDLIPNPITKKLQSLNNMELFSFVKIHKKNCLSNKFRKFWLSLSISFNTVSLSLLYKGHLNKK